MSRAVVGGGPVRWEEVRASLQLLIVDAAAAEGRASSCKEKRRSGRKRPDGLGLASYLCRRRGRLREKPPRTRLSRSSVSFERPRLHPRYRPPRSDDGAGSSSSPIRHRSAHGISHVHYEKISRSSRASSARFCPPALGLCRVGLHSASVFAFYGLLIAEVEDGITCPAVPRGEEQGFFLSQPGFFDQLRVVLEVAHMAPSVQPRQ